MKNLRYRFCFHYVLTLIFMLEFFLRQNMLDILFLTKNMLDIFYLNIGKC
jgi:hypothetical protein